MSLPGSVESTVHNVHPYNLRQSLLAQNLASKRVFRDLRTCEANTTLNETNLTLFEAKVTHFRRLASVSLANCDTLLRCMMMYSLYSLAVAGVAKYSQVLPSPLTLPAAKCLVLPSPPTHPPPPPIIIISPRCELKGIKQCQRYTLMT